MKQRVPEQGSSPGSFSLLWTLGGTVISWNNLAVIVAILFRDVEMKPHLALSFPLTHPGKDSVLRVLETVPSDG